MRKPQFNVSGKKPMLEAMDKASLSILEYHFQKHHAKSIQDIEGFNSA